MKKVLLLILVFCSEMAFAQITVSDFDSNFGPGAEIQAISRGKTKLIGSTFLYDFWSVGNIYTFAGAKLQDVPLKYDILGQELLLLKKESLYGVKLNFVTSFNLLNTNGEYLDFIVTKEWTIDGTPGTGVYQKLTEIGDFGLVKVTRVYLVKANYYVALDAGQKDDTYNKIEELYFINSRTKALVKVPRSKKKLIQYFNNENITSFIKNSKLDFKSEEGLIKLVEIANSSNTSN